MNVFVCQSSIPFPITNDSLTKRWNLDQMNNLLEVDRMSGSICHKFHWTCYIFWTHQYPVPYIRNDWTWNIFIQLNYIFSIRKYKCKGTYQ